MNPKYEKILKEYEELSNKLAKTTDRNELKRLGKKHAGLALVVEKIQKLKELEHEQEENQKLLGGEEDEEIRSLAQNEQKKLQAEIDKLQAEIDDALLPRDPMDENSAIMEIRAAAGGDEASLFAAELFRAYSKYSENKGWKIELISSSKNEIGGFKGIIFEIKGSGAFGYLKFESGVHRVQRVPKTEKSGRVHTSTVTVVVLPKIKQEDFKIEPKDLKVETSTSQGAGGQSVNTTYSAIKITHLPTGITAQSQDERSQIQNRAKAMDVITSRVHAHYEEEKRSKETAQRRSQIGTGDRSEKIRTYNFPQDRITDHRINQSYKQVELVLDGKLDEIITALLAEQKKRLQES